MNESLKRWLRAIAIGLVVFLILSVYLYVRRGYYDIYIINKVFGSSAVIIAGITLLLGPLRKNFIASSFMTIRRQLGILAFVFGVLHIIASLYQVNRFPWFSWYLGEWIPILFGIFAIVTWAYMTYISRNGKIVQLGADVWKNRLSIAGKIGFLAIFLHLTLMKYSGWIKWVNGQVKQSPELANPEYPPASLFIFVIMLLIIIFRLALRSPKKSEDGIASVAIKKRNILL